MAQHSIFTKSYKGDADAVRQLLKSEPELVDLVHNDLTPLHVAAQRGHSQVIRLLISHGADPNHKREEYEWTPLVWASYRGHLDAVQTLLKLGAKPYLNQPIHFAGQRGHKEICQTLVDHGAVDHLIEDNPAGLTFFKACYSFDSDRVEQILERDPNLVNVRDANGKTALHEVCTNGDLKTAKVLLKYAIPIEVKDDSDQKALDRAKNHNRKKLVAMLESISTST